MNDTVLQAGLGYRSLQDLLRTKLREDMATMKYAAGEKLNINVLAREYGVSPVPVREALRALEAEGLVEFSPNRGATVKALSASNIHEAFLIRIPLECVAVREALAHMVEDDFTSLSAILAQMEASDDINEWVELNRRFHLELYATAQLPRLHQILTMLWTGIGACLLLYAADPQERRDDDREHRALLDACRRRDAANATAIIEAHLADTRDGILRILARSS